MGAPCHGEFSLARCLFVMEKEIRVISIRVSKYNPIYRDENGAYTKNEWISYYDIVRCFEGEILTEEQYLEVENGYLNVIKNLYEIYPSLILNIEGLEQIDKNSAKWKDGDRITKDNIEELAREILREKVWCKLINENVEVHFGYDYYMYIVFVKGCSVHSIIKCLKRIRQKGLFIEKKPVIYYE